MMEKLEMGARQVDGDAAEDDEENKKGSNRYNSTSIAVYLDFVLNKLTYIGGSLMTLFLVR